MFFASYDIKTITDLWENETLILGLIAVHTSNALEETFLTIKVQFLFLDQSL